MRTGNFDFPVERDSATIDAEGVVVISQPGVNILHDSAKDDTHLRFEGDPLDWWQI